MTIQTAYNPQLSDSKEDHMTSPLEDLNHGQPMNSDPPHYKPGSIEHASLAAEIKRWNIDNPESFIKGVDFDALIYGATMNPLSIAYYATCHQAAGMNETEIGEVETNMTEYVKSLPQDPEDTKRNHAITILAAIHEIMLERGMRSSSAVPSYAEFDPATYPIDS